MLQIYIFGEREQGFLDIDPGTSLDIEALADIFDEDLTTGEYSLPVDIPWTENNKRLMGFAERLENGSNRPTWWKVHVYENLQPQIMNAKMTLLEKVGNFFYQRGKFSASISSTKGLFGAQIAGKKISDLKLGGPITWTAGDSRKFAYDVMTGVYPGFDFLSFVPLAIENFFDSARPDYAGEFLAKDTVNNVIVSGSSWTFGRPLSANPSIAAATGHPEYNDYRTVPFFKLKWVFRQAFQEFGYSISGAWLDDPAWDDLVLFNTVAIENYSPTTYQDFNQIIKPADHMPDYLLSEWLRDLCRFFCCYPTFLQSEVKLRYRKSSFREKSILSLNEVISGEFSSTMPVVDSGSQKTGYKLNYVWDSNDGYYSDRVKELTGKTVVGSVARFSDLATLNPGYSLTINHLAYVEAENMYYSVADATTLPIKWEVFSERLDGFTNGAGEDSIDIPVSTVCQYVVKNTFTLLLERKPRLGCRQTGNYINNAGVRVITPFGLRLFFASMEAIAGVNQPVSANYNRDANDARTRPYHLAWQGEDGLGKTLHTEWESFKLAAEKVKTTAVSNDKVLTELASHNVYEVFSVQFLPYQVTRKIPGDGRIELEIVPL